MVILGNRVNMSWSDLLDAARTSKLPGDLILQILVWLPAKSVLGFKSVSRAWYFLIKSPIFIAHRRALSSCSNQLSLFVHTRNTEEGNGHTFSWLLERSFGEPVLINLRPPFDAEDVEVVGSINGLVCLSLCRDAISVMIWNPALRRHCHTPSAQLLLENNERVSVGFGYDEKTDVYKVVRILYSKDYPGMMKRVRVEIYSTGTDAWRTVVVGNFPWLCNQKTCGAVVCGSPYWYAYACQGRQSQQVIMWFDASKECFGCTHLPFALSKKIGLGVMGEHPVAFSQHGVLCFQQDEDLSFVDTWKLIKRDDGGGGVLDYVEKLNIIVHSSVERILGFWRNGKTGNWL